jgi:ABC-type lipoprotein export system ATPase subunit
MNEPLSPKVNIHLSGLSKTYHAKVGPALKIPGTLQFYAGEVVAILGYSASGKSTLLNQIGLIDTIDVDSIIAIRYNGKLTNVQQLTENEKNDIRKTRFGFIFQAGHLLSHFNVGTNIAVPLHLNAFPKNEVKARVDRLVRIAFPERPPVKQYPRTLSAGQYIRTAVVRALAHDPAILLADEPTGSLDPLTGRKIMASIVDGWMHMRRKEKSFIFVTHDYRLAYDYADRIVVLSSGSLMLDLKRKGGSFWGYAENRSVTFDHPWQLLEAMEVGFHNKDNSDRLCNGLRPSLGDEYQSKRLCQSDDHNVGLIRESSGSIPLHPSLTGFSLKYAFEELVYNLKLTSMNVAAMSLLIFSALVIGGILLGAKSIIDREIAGDPLLKRLILYASSSTLSGEMSETVITQDHIDKILSLSSGSGGLSFQEPVKTKGGMQVWPRGDAVSHAMPWADVNLRFYTSDGELTAPLPGRTVDRDDPLLGYLNAPPKLTIRPLYTPTFSYMDNRGNKHSFPFGIIISDKILEEVLRYSLETPPDRIGILLSRGRRVGLRLLGIANNIPDGKFLVTEPFHAAYLQNSWTPEDLFNQVFWGPFSADVLRQCYEKVSHYVALKKGDYPLLSMTVNERLVPGEFWFTFSLETDDKLALWTKSDFQNFLFLGLEYQLPREIKSPDFQYSEPVYPKGVAKNIDELGRGEIVLTLGVYFHHIEDVIEAPKFLSQMDLGLEMGNVEYVKQLVHMKNFGYMIFISLFMLLGVTASLNLFLSFYQNIEGKIAEIGLLRAIGASKAMVLKFYLIEAGIIWLLALVFGGVLAYIMGPICGQYVAGKYEIYHELPLFLLSTGLVLLVASISVLMCLSSTFLATQWIFTKITPANAVRYNG